MHKRVKWANVHKNVLPTLSFTDRAANAALCNRPHAATCSSTLLEAICEGTSSAIWTLDTLSVIAFTPDLMEKASVSTLADK